MAFALEALQSKSKLNNIRAQEFVVKNMWPEMRERETETLIDMAKNNLKNLVQNCVSKLKIALGRPIIENAIFDNVTVVGCEVVVTHELNDDGFVEVELVKEGEEVDKNIDVKIT